MKLKCAICNGKMIGLGNNATPVVSGWCCDSCNVKKVLPARRKLEEENGDKNK